MIKNLLIVIFTLFFSFSAQAKTGFNIFAYSREAPETKIFDEYGKAVQLQDFKGDFLIAVFWSKTCIPCLREMKDLNSFAQKVKDNGVKVILVSAEKEWENPFEQVELLNKYGGQDLDFYVDRKSALANEFGIFTSPHSVLIDTEGMEIGRIRGAVDWDDEDIEEYIYRLKVQSHQ